MNCRNLQWCYHCNVLAVAGAGYFLGSLMLLWEVGPNKTWGAIGETMSRTRIEERLESDSK